MKIITKGTGWDWVISYRDGDSPEIQFVTVFGQMTPELALSEARNSIDFAGDNPDYEIVGLERIGAQKP